MTSKPYDFQREDAAKLNTFNGRALVAWEPGTGKTFAALYYYRKYLQKGTVVVLCPATVKEHWRREAAKHLGIRAEVLSGRSPPDGVAQYMKQMGTVFVLNYDILQGWLEFFQGVQPRLVILDEAQYCKSRSAIRTKCARVLCRKAPYVLALSGTPLVNRPAELWPTLNMLRPRMFPSFWEYAHKFCNMRRTPWGWDFSGASNLDELHSLLTNHLMVRRRKEDVLKDLPAKTRTVVPMELSRKDREEYEEAADDLIKWLVRKGKLGRAKKAAQAEQLVRMGYLKRLAGRLKKAHVVNWVQDFLDSSDGKLILFGLHRKLIRAVEAHFGGVSVRVDGSVTGKARQRAIDAFNLNPKKRLFIGNIHAAGVGWSCTSSSTVAFCEIDWVPGNMIQAEDRAHGLFRGVAGQAVSVYYLVADETIESYLVELIHRKQRVLDKTLDGRDEGDFDVMDKLEEILLARGKSTKKRRIKK